MRDTGLPLVLGDALWGRYRIGEEYAIADASGAGAARHDPFTSPRVRSNGPVTRERTVDALQRRGVLFLACDDTFRGADRTLAAAELGTAETTRAELLAARLPGVVPVPAMAVASGRMQERGISYVYAGSAARHRTAADHHPTWYCSVSPSVVQPPAAHGRRHRERVPVLGLRENRRQFALLVLVNAFVGAMVGLERSVLPLLGEREFGLASASAALSFVATFGVVKALTNLLAGRLGDRYGRKRVLVAGWLFALPVPFLVIWAPTWSWIIVANVLLGINQGLAWSTAVVMKIDLVGPRQRGLAMGLNEFAGYLAVALSALATGMIASAYGLRPEPFYLGIAVAVVGLALSVLFVRDTSDHAHLEARAHGGDGQPAGRAPAAPPLRELLARGTWRDPALASASQAGLVNNLNDGLAWGLFPIFFAAAGLSLREIGVLAFVYPATWGIAQLATGALSDRWGRKWMIVGGMLLQGAALAAMAAWHGFAPWIASGVALGLGTALVYPTLLAAIGDVAHPTWRGSAVGVYRLWRDLGYAVGALMAGALADAFGMTAAIAVVAALTAASGIVVAVRMPETLARAG